MFLIVSQVLNQNMNTHGGLVRVDIPASDNNQPFPPGPDPKTWKGPWKSVTNPDDIASQVCAANHRQYNQAHHTPFTSTPLINYFGYCGNTKGADDLLAGKLPPESVTQSLMPETIQIIKTLSTPPARTIEFSPTSSKPVCLGISDNDGTA